MNPDLEPTADASLRTCFREQLESSVASGRAFLPDSTPEDDAIIKEPLFRRPCQVSSGDCPFATAYENADTFFNCCCTLALFARSFGKFHNADATSAECVADLYAVVDRFVSGYGELSVVEACWAADALLLFNILYPTDLDIGELALLHAFAKAPPECQQSLHLETALRLSDIQGLDAVDIRLARVFWQGLQRAWEYGLRDFLVLVLEHNGSHKTCKETIAKFKEGLERSVKAVWLVYSHDGITPPSSYHPCNSARSPDLVCRQHVDPVFVGNRQTGQRQRASPIGLKPHSYRQLLSELLGANIPDVECNVAINEGGMGLRVSSDPTILDEDGNQRTEKSISPVQTEGDDAAYGTREDKIDGAIKQKRAWDKNALLMKPLFTSVNPPLGRDRRERGEFGLSQFFQHEHARMHRDGQRMSESMVAAKTMMMKAANSDVARKVNTLV